MSCAIILHPRRGSGGFANHSPSPCGRGLGRGGGAAVPPPPLPNPSRKGRGSLSIASGSPVLWLPSLWLPSPLAAQSLAPQSSGLPSPLTHPQCSGPPRSSGSPRHRQVGQPPVLVHRVAIGH